MSFLFWNIKYVYLPTIFDVFSFSRVSEWASEWVSHKDTLTRNFNTKWKITCRKPSNSFARKSYIFSVLGHKGFLTLLIYTNKTKKN